MKGQCVCGATTFTVELKNHNVNACHCSICRKQTSGILMTINTEQGSLKFIKDDHLSIYDSSDWGKEASVIAAEPVYSGVQKIIVTAISMYFLLTHNLKI